MDIDNADANTPAKMPAAPSSPHCEEEPTTQNASETPMDLERVRLLCYVRGDDKASPSDNEGKGKEFSSFG